MERSENQSPPPLYSGRRVIAAAAAAAPRCGVHRVAGRQCQTLVRSGRSDVQYRRSCRPCRGLANPTCGFHNSINFHSSRLFSVFRELAPRRRRPNVRIRFAHESIHIIGIAFSFSPERISPSCAPYASSCEIRPRCSRASPQCVRGR